MCPNQVGERPGPSPPARVDVLVLGGGPAGVAAAVEVVNRGASVLLVEQTSYELERIGESFPPPIVRVLASLGLWDSFDQAKHLPSYGVRSYWGSDEPHERSFITDAYGTGWHVDRRAFDLSLAHAAERRNVPVLKATKLLSCEPGPTPGWIVQLTTSNYSTTVSARFVIDATGRHASLVRRLGGNRIACDQLVGIYGYYVLRDEGVATDNFMLIEAAEQGWWYSVPLPENRLAVTFMTDADLSARAVMRDVSQWHQQLALAKHTAARTEAYTLAGPLKLRSANNSRSNPLIGQGWLSVGDAAVAYDPLSGDGVLRALDTGKRGASAALAALDGDESPAHEYSRELLSEFELYLQRQITFYSRERRWVTAPFWSRRQ